MLKERVGGTGWVELRLDRPERRNALSHALVDELEAAFGRAERGGCRIAVLGAEGPVFCAGGDRAEVHTDPVASDRLLGLLRTTPLLVVARVEGPVVGAGVSVVRRCPVAIGTPAATFSLPEASMGVFPVPVAHLEGTVTRRRLLDVALRSSPVTADEAVAAGLLTAVVDDGEVDAAVEAWVASLLEQPAVAATAGRYWQREVDREVAERDAWLRAEARR